MVFAAGTTTFDPLRSLTEPGETDIRSLGLTPMPSAPIPKDAEPWSGDWTKPVVVVPSLPRDSSTLRAVS